MSVDPMLPVPHRIAERHVETHDSVSLVLEPVDGGLAPVRPGQFTMVYKPGVGEIAISVSGSSFTQGALLTQTIRDVGAVSRALHGSEPGTIIGARGPFGTGWDIESATGRDVVIVAGGVGLAPLRPVLLYALAHRADYRRVVVVAGARRPAEFLFRDQLREWAATPGVELVQTVDAPAVGWRGPVGFVTEALRRLDLDAERTLAFVCGPEPMMQLSAKVLMRKGVPAERIRVSLERNMQCGVALCGHCQLGPLLICRDGPVLDYAHVQPLLAVREL